MGRLTEIITYLNSSTEDWQRSGGIDYSQFKRFNIDATSKSYRKWYKYGKEDTYEEYIQNKKNKVKVIKK